MPEGEHETEGERPLRLLRKAGDGRREADRPGAKGHAGQDREPELCGLGKKPDAKQGKDHRAQQTAHQRAADAEAFGANAGRDRPQYAAEGHEAANQADRSFVKVEAEQVKVKEEEVDRETKAEEHRRGEEKPELPPGCLGGQSAEIPQRRPGHLGLPGSPASKSRQSIAC